MHEKINQLPTCHPILAINRTGGEEGDGCLVSFLKFFFHPNIIIIRYDEKVILYRSNENGVYYCRLRFKGLCNLTPLKCIPEQSGFIVRDTDRPHELFQNSEL